MINTKKQRLTYWELQDPELSKVVTKGRKPKVRTKERREGFLRKREVYNYDD